MGKIITIVLWAWIPFSGQPLWGQTPSVGVQPGHNQKQKAELATSDTKTDQRGTKEHPFVIDTEGHRKSEDETAKDKREDDYKRFIDRRTLNLAEINAILTGILMIAGVVGVILALITLNIIRRQTSHMVNSERAWLIIPMPPNQRLSLNTPLNQFTFSLINKGRTIARIMDFDRKYVFLERGVLLPSVPVYPPREPHDLTHLHGYVLAVDDPFNDIVIVIDEWIEVDRLRDLRDGLLYLYVYGRINYVDFSKETRTIQVCYRFAPDSTPDAGIEQVGLGGQWRLCIPPYAPAAYNRHT